MIKKLKPHIEERLPKAKWNFDVEDIDKILQIDSEENIVLITIDLLNNHNYSCEELEGKTAKKQRKKVTNLTI